jgi:hypothetical protein
MSDKLTVTWLKEYEGEIHTLKLPSKDGRFNNPFRRGVGLYEDTYGGVWEVKGMFAGSSMEESYILARPMGGGMETSSKRWIPYKVEIVRTDEGANEATTDRRLAPASDEPGEA